jgi:hypothetical protein
MGRASKIGFVALLLVAGSARPSVVAQGGLKVDRWGRFEVALNNARSYANRYTDVSLDVTYTRPDGSTVSFWGFYDGDATWKIRFMPDQVGTWQYQARFSDGSGEASGTFTCVTSTIPGILTKDTRNPQWFGLPGGGHVLVRSFHVADRFFAANWPSSSRTAFLDWAQSEGYNMLSVGSHYLNRNVSGRGAGWDTPDLWPLDAAEFRQLEALLDDLASRRMFVYPFAGFFGRNSDYPTSAADQTRFIRYTLARLGPYWNMLLNVAGPEPNMDNYLASADVARLGAEIRRLDVFAHALSVHNATGDDPYKESNWSSYGTLQGPKTTSRSTLSEGLLRNHHPSKPLYAHETLWPGNRYHPAYSDVDIRKHAYVINMSATALNFADMDGDSSSGFSGTLDLSRRVQSRHDIVKRVWDFFASLPFYEMSPRQDLVSTGYCLAAVGQRYLVYLPSRVTVSLSVTNGSYEILWINAQNPADRRAGGTTTAGQNLAPPADGDDWLLYLTRSDGTGGGRFEAKLP